jgi:hypothetical protein
LVILEKEINSQKEAQRVKTRQLSAVRVKSLPTRLVERRLLNKLKAYKRALIVLKKRRRSPHSGPLWWYEQMLQHPNEFAGTFVLRVAIQRLRAKYRRFPTRIELAEELNISEATLYRRPFGRQALHRAYRGRPTEAIAAEDASDDQEEPYVDEESYIHDLEQELSPEERHSHTRKTLPSGVHAVQHRQSEREAAQRKLKRERAHCVELIWEEDSLSGVQMLRMYPLGRIDAKCQVELIEAEASCNDPGIRIDIRRNSRKVRRARALEAHDSTFGGWTAAVYEIEADGKCRWRTNFDESSGHTDSAAQACSEVLSAIERHKTRFPPVVNLKKMLRESRP